MSKPGLVLCMAMALLPLLAGAAQAFHDGGVGRCEACHSMHGSGQRPGGQQWLLRAADASSVCLNCHAGVGSPDIASVASPDGSAMTPGGDFYWLKKDFLWDGGSSPGASHGHNIVAWDFGFAPDPRLAESPGGTYPSDSLGCTSCHDPHGEKPGIVSGSGSYGDVAVPGTVLGNYRLLGGDGYDGGQQTYGYSFAYDAPVARQNSSRKFGESDSSHVDYGSGMSEWCANCHAGYFFNEHSAIEDGFEHPSSELLGGSRADRYNAYVKTGDLSGTRETSYLQFVPFERNETDPLRLDPVSTFGPNSRGMVMCLTCHRAHASAFRSAGRWDLTATVLMDSHPQAGDGGVTGNDVLYSYYGRDILSEFGSGQREFCDKCHDSPMR